MRSGFVFIILILASCSTNKRSDHGPKRFLAAEGHEVGAIFRIKDVGAPHHGHREKDLGHCTAFVHPEENLLVSAGHCFHRKGFAVLGEQGKAILELDVERAFMARSTHGLLDLSFFELSQEQTDVLRASFSDVLPQVQEQPGYLIAGYPQFRRSEQLTAIRCEEYEVTTLRQKIEHQLDIINLKCRAYDENGRMLGALSHEMVKGASGSPAYLNGKLIGVAFNFNYESDIKENVLKVIRFSAISYEMPYQMAWRSFNLNRKLFEEMKLPNKIRGDLDIALMSDKKVRHLNTSLLKSIKRVSDHEWLVEKLDGQVYTIDPKLFSSRLREFLIKVSALD